MPVYTAIYEANEPKPLLLQGQPIPVYQHLPADFGADRYVLLSQPTCTRSGGGQGCKTWEATVLLDCVTLFAPGYVSSIPADEMAGLVAERVDGIVLPLGGGLQASRGEVEQILGLQDAFDGEQTDVHRYLRLRTEITQHTLTPSL